MPFTCSLVSVSLASFFGSHSSFTNLWDCDFFLYKASQRPIHQFRPFQPHLHLFKAFQFRDMTSEMSLKKLVKLLLSRRTSPKTFTSLVGQLHAQKSIVQNEFLDALMVLENGPGVAPEINDVRIAYVLQLSHLEDAYCTYFWACLDQLPLSDQVLYLVRLTKYLLEPHKSPQVLSRDLLASQVAEYVARIAGHPEAENVTLQLSQVALLWAALAESPLPLVSAESYRQTLAVIVPELGRLGLVKFRHYVLKKAALVLQASDLSALSNASTSAEVAQKRPDQRLTTDQNTARNFLMASNSKKAGRVAAIKKYCWLNSMMRHWTVPASLATFLQNYETRFGLPAKRPFDTVHDLVHASFTGLVMALEAGEAPYVLFNWHNFILRLPPVLALVRLAEPVQESLEDAILSAFNTLDEAVVRVVTSLTVARKTPYDLRQNFIRSCLYHELLTISSFHKFFPMEAHKFTQQTLNHELHSLRQVGLIEKDLSTKLLEINSEFISLEESDLVEYLASLPGALEYLFDKQRELASKINAVFDRLVKSKQFEKLNRLILALLASIPVLNLIFLHDEGPYNLLNRLVVYVDSQSFAVDDEDFQERYLHLGMALLAVILIVETFLVDLSSVVASSYTVDYVNNFYYRMCGGLTNIVRSSEDEDATIVANYNGLEAEWINALFDDANDGLSDELVKGVSVKQIYKLVPLIYQQAILAVQTGKISMAVLNNGIDYLLQVFLVPCTLPIVSWLVRNVSEADGVAVNFLNETIRSNLGEDGYSVANNEVGLAFRTVLNVSGKLVLAAMRRIKNSDSSEVAKKVELRLSAFVDRSYWQREVTVPSENKFSLEEQFRQAVIGLVHTNSMVGEASLAAHFAFISQALKLAEPLELVLFLVHEIEVYQRSTASNEDVKLFVNLAVFILLSEAVNTEEELQHWLLKLQSVEKAPCVAVEVDKAFTLSMDFHYSSIFDDNGPREQTTAEDEEDDLFDEKPQAEIGETTDIRALAAAGKRKNGLLEAFLALGHSDDEKEMGFQRLVSILRGKMVEELEWMR